MKLLLVLALLIMSLFGNLFTAMVDAKDVDNDSATLAQPEDQGKHNKLATFFVKTSKGSFTFAVEKKENVSLLIALISNNNFNDKPFVKSFIKGPCGFSRNIERQKNPNYHDQWMGPFKQVLGVESNNKSYDYADKSIEPYQKISSLNLSISSNSSSALVWLRAWYGMDSCIGEVKTGLAIVEKLEPGDTFSTIELGQIN